MDYYWKKLKMQKLLIIFEKKTWKSSYSGINDH